MKIDRAKLKKTMPTGGDSVPSELKSLVAKLKDGTEDQIIQLLTGFNEWTHKQTDLHHWIDVLDKFDSILASCATRSSESVYCLAVDLPANENILTVLKLILNFTIILIKHSFSLHVYTSFDHLSSLLLSSNMEVVTLALDLLIALYKRCSNYTSSPLDRKPPGLKARLSLFAENWGGKEHGVSLSQCAQKWGGKAPASVENFVFEFQRPLTISSSSTTVLGIIPGTNTIGATNLPSSGATVTTEKVKIEVLEVYNRVKLGTTDLFKLNTDLAAHYRVPEESKEQFWFLLRLAANMGDLKQRQLCVQARLLAIGVNASSESSFQFSPQLVNEIVALLSLPGLYELKGTALRTLRAFIAHDRHSKLKIMLDATGLNSYHGLLPNMVRSAINLLVNADNDPKAEKLPRKYTIPLFSFVFHFGYYEAGRTAMNQVNIIEHLLKLVQCQNAPLDSMYSLHSRAIKIIETLTARDMGILQSYNGLLVFVQRLEYEVNTCRVSQQYEIKIDPSENGELPLSTEASSSSAAGPVVAGSSPSNDTETAMQVDQQPPPPTQPNASSSLSSSNELSSSLLDTAPNSILVSASDSNLLSPASRCPPLRASLIKSLVNFLRKATQYATLSEHIRQLMTGNLAGGSSVSFPATLRHLISNPEYYGTQVFSNAIELVALYIHHEPSLLSTIQQNGLSGVILHSLFSKPNIPFTRDVVGTLPNVLTALCLNANGLNSFVQLKPFDKIYAIFTKPEYLVMLQTAPTIGTTGASTSSTYDNTITLAKAVDQLIRHQPLLRIPGLNGLVRVLEELIKIGNDPKYVAKKERYMRSGSSGHGNEPVGGKTDASDTRTEVPILDYIVNVMRFLQTILSSTTQHSQEFIRQHGLTSILSLLTLPIIPKDFAFSNACYFVSTTLWWLLKYTHDKNIYIGVMEALKKLLMQEPTHTTLLCEHFKSERAGGSELVAALIAKGESAGDAQTAGHFESLPEFKCLQGALTYINILMQICKSEHSEQIKALCLEQWASPLGQELIGLLSKLYVFLSKRDMGILHSFNGLLVASVVDPDPEFSTKRFSPRKQLTNAKKKTPTDSSNSSGTPQATVGTKVDTETPPYVVHLIYINQGNRDPRKTVHCLPNVDVIELLKLRTLQVKKYEKKENLLVERVLPYENMSPKLQYTFNRAGISSEEEFTITALTNLNPDKPDTLPPPPPTPPGGFQQKQAMKSKFLAGTQQTQQQQQQPSADQTKQQPQQSGNKKKESENAFENDSENDTENDIEDESEDGSEDESANESENESETVNEIGNKTENANEASGDKLEHKRANQSVPKVTTERAAKRPFVPPMRGRRVPPGPRVAPFPQPPRNNRVQDVRKYALMKTRRASPFYQRPSEPFQSNFNIITYINTEPLVPTKFAPKVGLASLLLGQQGGGMVGGGGVQHPLGPGTSYLQPIGDGGGGQFELSEADQLLLEQLSGVDRIHVVSGLCKVDKLDLALLLNNEAFLEQKPCRIIYLQSMSILTFWMALKVKELGGDYHWNSSGYQITLESKSSPNNNIIFELSTFMRALNLNIDTSLVTHLIVDIDHADHVFFNLFLLYIKTNFDSLRHLRPIIFGHDHKQARALYDYFAPEIVNLVDWMDFHEHVIPEMLCGVQTGYVEPVNVVHLYLEDIGHYLSLKGESLDSGTNSELERLLPRVLHANSNISPFVMIEFISAFPVLINYQCHYLNGLTPLIVTVLRGTVDQLYSILAAGANAHLASWNGMTPIEWAIQAKRDKQFHLLMVHLSATNISFDLNLKQHYANKFVNVALNLGDLDAKIHEILVKKVQQLPPLYDVDYSVILRLLGMIRQLNQSHQPNTPLGTVLVLLPSYNVISTLRKQIIASLAPNCEYPFTTFCLYLPNNELDIAVSLFNSVGGSQVRIILSTFTLDCLLLSDIRYVINTGIRLSKVQSGFTPTSQYRLVPNQSAEKVSEYRYYRDLFDQSTGTPVYIYNLYSRADVLNHQLVGSEENDEPDLGYAETDSIYNCVFASKYFKLKADQKIGDLFGQMVSAPPKLVIDNAVYFLKSLNMFDDKERFNELGRILVDLSIEPHYGKMIIYSVLLRCLDPILTIVCALSSPNCFEITSANSAQRALDMQSLYELSHQSFSDHLTYVYAFQKWQELCRSNPKNVSYDRSGIVLFSFELIYSLRTKVLGQLRACGFVKGKGAMNIRQLNANSDNFTLVKAAICAGQSKDNLALIHRDHVPRLVHRDDREEPFTYLHPNSVLSYQLASGEGASQLTGNLVMFDRKVTSGQVSYLSNCTLVNPLTVAIFTDENRPDQIVLKDNCIQLGSSSYGLKITGEDVSQCFELRTRWQQYAKKRIINMHTPVSEDENMMIAELVRFCSMSDEQNGFGDHREIGRAPQVMSTYFCSTKMIAPGAAVPN